MLPLTWPRAWSRDWCETQAASPWTSPTVGLVDQQATRHEACEGPAVVTPHADHSNGLFQAGWARVPIGLRRHGADGGVTSIRAWPARIGRAETGRAGENGPGYDAGRFQRLTLSAGASERIPAGLCS